jgi:hypothetical protein
VEQILLDLAFKMATVFGMVTVSCAEKSGDIQAKFDFPVNLVVDYDPQGISVKLKRGKPFIFMYYEEFYFFLTWLILFLIGIEVGPCHHGMARPVVMNGGDGLQIWGLSANMLNK